jgi:predicted RNase H-like HicB family nuclease
MMQFTVILEPQEEGGYTAHCLELPGAISEGDTKTEALENIKEAIELILEVLREDLKGNQYSNAEIHKVELADVQ